PHGHGRAARREDRRLRPGGGQSGACRAGKGRRRGALGVARVDRRDVHHRRALHRHQRPLLRRRLPGRLHPRGRPDPRHRPGGVHRLRGLRARVPGGGDLPRGRASGQVGGVRRDQLRLRKGHGRREPAHGRVRDRARRPEPAAGIAARPEVVKHPMHPKTLDHVALWVADRDPIADLLTGSVGMHVIDRTDAFTLVGSDARRGKLTLFAAEGPRERGALKHVALRVNDLDAAFARLPAGLEVERPRPGEAYFDTREGLRVGLVEAPTDVDYDLDHAALYSERPEETAEEYERLGFSPAEPGPSRAPRVEVGGAYVEFHPGEPRDPERPLLNHLAVLVDAADEHIEEARETGIEIDNVVDAANTYAV